jgi:4-hydroxybenzoate polyprenyltransferase
MVADALYPATAARSGSPLRILGHALVEARPVVQVVFAARFVVGWVLSGAALGVPWLGLTGWVAAAVAVYVLNGITDLDGDRTNGSHRPLASGRLAPGEAKAVTAGCTAAALLAGLALGSVYLALLLGFLFVGAAYSMAPFRWKDTTTGAAASVVALGFLTYLAGAAATGTRPGPILLLYAAVMSAWMGGVGAVAKDFSDVRGDAGAGRRTAVIRFGPARTRAAVGYGAVLVAAALLAVTPAFPRLLLPAVALALGAAAVVVATRRGTGPARRPYRAFMLAQYLSNAAALVA